MTKPEDEKNEGEEKKTQQIIMLGGSDSDIRTVAVYGDVTEELAKEVVSGIWYLRATAKTEEPVDIEDPETDFEEVIRPLEMVISTNGGNADDMFAIYDAMRICREEVEIETLGIGKVMSAGVLLLAAGTKGKRKIGKHCRIMMHAVRGGHMGSIHSLENEMEETRWIQKQHIKALCEETDLTERQLKNMLNKNMDVYLSAEDAVNYGIADIIV